MGVYLLEFGEVGVLEYVECVDVEEVDMFDILLLPVAVCPCV